MIDSDTARAEVIQIGQEAYIRGNAAAISGFFGLTKNDPQQLANTWISIVPSDGGEYTTVISAVTLKSDFQQPDALRTTVRRARRHPRRPALHPDHRARLERPGTAPPRATLYVTDSKTPIPVEYKAGQRKATSTTTWSRWGHTGRLTAPPDADSVRVAVRLISRSRP